MFQVVPSIDLRGGRVVRLQQGDYARELQYVLDPIETARSFHAAGAQYMHIVDLDGARQGAVTQLDLIRQIVQAVPQLRVQVGGGVRSTQDVKRLLECGAARVVVGTRAIEDWAWFESLMADGSLAGRVVLALDARDGRVATRGWTQTTPKLAVEIARQVSDWPLAGILYTDVARDGMLEGPNLTQTQLLAQAGRVPVIASGGVAGLEDVRKLLELPIWGVVVGRSLHEGRLDLQSAIALARRRCCNI
ncbi:1-(5-phosphoribosyl)-5-[(5-phosphoribosylamino)methylideneamino]imidazole-4-carboxamide isomerase [Fontivita pretiosa]|uniref:1-(5-phosphoribosyl)-5-[(5- phosphoribosylamino)methylideneamino]imidazole-4- carboxamide isomerase n=1 Tax=Fontivita pretiosa TaxID=2989684 RepID=UPI003D184361